ncbi:hypothetical protein [[Mycoplasma] collis]|uniref:hypothetical protein n=1 Tax=[Mycoplasma] collis TaxID=2127 RepID=UPI00051B7A21|nr:hypothetical protein [[Mycoplasma] collis]
MDLFIWDTFTFGNKKLRDNENYKFKQEFLDKIWNNNFFTVKDKNEFIKYFDENHYSKEKFKNLDIDKFFEKFNILIFYDEWGQKLGPKIKTIRFYRTINENNNKMNIQLFDFDFMVRVQPDMIPLSDIIFFAYDKKYKINVDASNLSNLTLEQKVEFLEKMQKDYSNE